MDATVVAINMVPKTLATIPERTSQSAKNGAQRPPTMTMMSHMDTGNTSRLMPFLRPRQTPKANTANRNTSNQLKDRFEYQFAGLLVTTAIIYAKKPNFQRLSA